MSEAYSAVVQSDSGAQILFEAKYLDRFIEQNLPANIISAVAATSVKPIEILTYLKTIRGDFDKTCCRCPGPSSLVPLICNSITAVLLVIVIILAATGTFEPKEDTDVLPALLIALSCIVLSVSFIIGFVFTCVYLHNAFIPRYVLYRRPKLVAAVAAVVGTVFMIAFAVSFPLQIYVDPAVIVLTLCSISIAPLWYLCGCCYLARKSQTDPIILNGVEKLNLEISSKKGFSASVEMVNVNGKEIECVSINTFADTGKSIPIGTDAALHTIDLETGVGEREETGEDKTALLH